MAAIPRDRFAGAQHRRADRHSAATQGCAAGLEALRRAAADTGDTETIRLLRRAEAHQRDRPARSGAHGESSPVVCPVFEVGGQVVRTISTVMRFDTAVEVTTSQLRVELMFPADDAAEAYFRAHQPA